MADPGGGYDFDDNSDDEKPYVDEFGSVQPSPPPPRNDRHVAFVGAPVSAGGAAVADGED